MKRRALIALIGLAAASPLHSHAQTAGASRRIGFLHPTTAAPDSPTLRLLRPVWQSLGYSEPESVLLRSAESDPSRLPTLARELVELGAGVLIAVGPAAVRAASGIAAPVVAIDLETDPIRAGLIASFSRPGGNVTGLFLDQPSLAGKWLELLKEAAPKVKRVALVWNPATPPDQLETAQQVAAARGIPTLTLEVRAPDGYDSQFQELAGGPESGVIQLGTPGFSVGAKQFAAAALRYRLPTITHQSFFAVDGALMSYGPARGGYFSRAVLLADKVLKGEKPGEIPIERPSQFEFVVNLKTARALGLALSPTLLAQADEVIE
jgi:putative ABC transport system substrate-binding protein